jgi:hypothetical protein
MASMEVENAPKGALGRLRALARAILSASAEEEMRLQHQEFLKVNSKANDGRSADRAARVSND